MGMSELKYLIRKSSVHGRVNIPSSKSITHRMMICAAMCEGATIISNPLVSDDTKATLNALKILGAKVRKFNSEVVDIQGPISAKNNIVIDCGESGSTLRFMLPVVAALGGKVTLTGKGRLPKRPIKELVDVLRKLGAKIEGESLPITVSGRIHSGKTKISGSVSSQFISGLMLSLHLLKRESTIELTSELQSKPYVDLTMDVLGKYGVAIHESKNYRKFDIPGNQKIIPSKQFVEGDYSSASFMLAVGVLCGKIELSEIRYPSKQGDCKVVDILEQMGAEVNKRYRRITVKKSKLKAITIDAKDIPDAVPILAVVATQAKGKTKIINAERLREKESDRLAAITKELNKMGAGIVEKKDGLEINGPVKLNGAKINPHGDHRIAMACAIAGIISEGDTEISNPECVKKSYPAFFKQLSDLGAEVMPTTNVIGEKLQISVYGSSHGKRIGVKISGVVAGTEMTKEYIQNELNKRRSYTKLSTGRMEKDEVIIVSGIKNGITSGEQIIMEIENKDVKGKDYEKILNTPRPGHADYNALIKYDCIVDMRGGGFFSGRMTACLVMAGAVAKKILEKQGVVVRAYAKQIGKVKLEKELSEEEIGKTYKYETRCPDHETSELMKKEILNAKENGDSVGGIVECNVYGMAIGIGEPLFNSVESSIAHGIFSIPAIKGIEFGSGFSCAEMKGSEHNDEYIFKNGKTSTITNNAGGIQGGISNGMPIVFRVAIKPTSSISKEQKTIDVKNSKETSITIEGRHDPCIVVRVPVVVESMTAIMLADLLMRR